MVGNGLGNAPAIKMEILTIVPVTIFPTLMSYDNRTQRMIQVYKEEIIPVSTSLIAMTKVKQGTVRKQH